MHCPHCQAELNQISRFCPRCGAALAPGDVPNGDPTPGDREPDTLDDRETVYTTPTSDDGVVLETGQDFAGRYRVRDKLGQGGMGIVYRVTEDLTGKDLALKIIRPELLGSESASRRFLREGSLARDLGHPNIATVYDVNESGGLTYVSMEYLQGTTLRERLRELRRDDQPMDADAALAVTREILKGLQVVHRAGIVHRDLKPENVMLLGEPGHSGQHRLKILDFGIARALDTTATLTVAGSTLGTMGYMAPEQLVDADTVGPQADLYSVAAMLYEMLVGAIPTGRWHLPSEQRPELPPALDQVVMQGLEADLDDRFADAGAFLRALDGVQPQRSTGTAASSNKRARAEPSPSPSPTAATVQSDEDRDLPAWLNLPLRVVLWPVTFPLILFVAHLITEPMFSRDESITPVYLLAATLLPALLPVSLNLLRGHPGNRVLRALAFAGAACTVFWIAILPLIWTGTVRYTHANPVEIAQLSLAIAVGAAAVSAIYSMRSRFFHR